MLRSVRESPVVANRLQFGRASDVAFSVGETENFKLCLGSIPLQLFSTQPSVYILTQLSQIEP